MQANKIVVNVNFHTSILIFDRLMIENTKLMTSLFEMRWLAFLNSVCKNETW